MIRKQNECFNSVDWIQRIATKVISYSNSVCDKCHGHTFYLSHSREHTHATNKKEQTHASQLIDKLKNICDWVCLCQRIEKKWNESNQRILSEALVSVLLWTRTSARVCWKNNFARETSRYYISELQSFYWSSVQCGCISCFHRNQNQFQAKSQQSFRIDLHIAATNKYTQSRLQIVSLCVCDRHCHST